MKLKFALIVLSFLFLFSCKPQSGSVPKAEKGVLDLRSTCDDLKDQVCQVPTVDLNGEWEFYWGEFLEPQPVGTDTVGVSLKPDPTDGVDYIPVPGSWNNFLLDGKPLGGKGYGTYRLRVLLPSPMDDSPLGIKIPAIGSAHELWIGDSLYGKAGTISEMEEVAKPGSHVKLYQIREQDFTLDVNGNRAIDIILKVSNYHHAKGGLWYPIKLGSYQTLSQKDKLQASIDFFLFGSILIMGLYHFGLYFLRRKDPSAFWFGMYCIAINWRILLTGEQYLESVFPDYHLFFSFLEYLNLVLLVPIFANFLYSLFPAESVEKRKSQIVWLSLAFATPILILPSFYYTWTVTAIQIFIVLFCIYVTHVLLKAIQSKRQGSKTFLAGFLFFFAIIVHDILFYQMILKTLPLFALGLFGFIFSQAAVLSMRFSGAFHQAELLSETLEQKSQRLEETALELSRLTESLEAKVQERTSELEEAKLEIEDLNQFTHQVNTLTNLNDIFIEVSKYMYDNYNVVGSWLFLPDEKKEYLYAYKAYSYVKMMEYQYKYLMTKKVPLKEIEGGMFYKTYTRKKTFYLFKISKFEFELDREFVKTLNMKSFLHVPLVRKEECVGIFAFSNLDQEMKLTKKDIRKISHLCSQIAGAIDTNHLLQQVQKEKEKAESARLEVDKLNEFTRLINSTSDISTIMKEVYNYLNGVFGLTHAWTLLVDKNSNELYTDENLLVYKENESFDFDFFMNFKEEINEKMGTLFHTYKSKVPLYIPDLKNTIIGTKNQFFNEVNWEIIAGSKLDSRIAAKGRLKSILQIPLILKGEIIGILNLTNSNEVKRLSKEEIDRLIRFSDQISGVIKNAQLLKETEEAKAQTEVEKQTALIAKAETERQKHETEELNKLIKSLNEESEIKPIMKKVHDYIKDNYNIPYYGLSIVDQDGEKMSLVSISLPDFVTEEERIRINQSSIEMNEKIGGHIFAFKTKKAVFTSHVKRSRLAPSEILFQETTKLQSLLIIPLILQNEPIGFLDLYDVKKMDLPKDDITKLSILGEQLAGIIHGSNLLKEVQEEKEKAIQAYSIAENERQKSERLLLNILPKDVAGELKEKGFAEPQLFESVSVMFTDFKGFTQIAESMRPRELVEELDRCFSYFDALMERYNLEKLKTIGDSYMCAGGIPKRNKTHATDCVLAALEIQSIMKQMKDLKEMSGAPYWELRLGIHSGPLVAGVIGERKFAYDVWGDTVNTASRMESSGTPGKINISGSTYELVKHLFDCEYRGRVNAKNKGEVNMYYVHGIKKEFSKEGEGKTPNGKFWERYGVDL